MQENPWEKGRPVERQGQEGSLKSKNHAIREDKHAECGDGFGEHNTVWRESLWATLTQRTSSMMAAGSPLMGLRSRQAK